MGLRSEVRRPSLSSFRTLERCLKKSYYSTEGAAVLIPVWLRRQLR
jgi:hypothetical protein